MDIRLCQFRLRLDLLNVLFCFLSITELLNDHITVHVVSSVDAYKHLNTASLCLKKIILHGLFVKISILRNIKSVFETGCTYLKCMFNKIFKYAWKFPSNKQVKIMKKIKINNMVTWNGIAKIIWGRNEYLWYMLINKYVIYMHYFAYI